MSESTSNKLTTVSTTYARAVILLLALNFCLTGYFILNITEANQLQIDSTQHQLNSAPSVVQTEAPTQEQQVVSSSEDETPSTLGVKEEK